MSSPDVELLQRENKKLKTDFGQKEKSFTEQRDKAKRIVKAQQLKLKTLQEEIAALKANESNQTELESLRAELGEKNEQIQRLKVDENGEGDMAEDLAAAQAEAKGKVLQTGSRERGRKREGKGNWEIRE